MVSDVTSFKFQWLKKRLDSEVKRKVFGQQTFDPDILQSTLDNSLLLSHLTQKLKRKTEEAIHLSSSITTLNGLNIFKEFETWEESRKQYNQEQQKYRDIRREMMYKALEGQMKANS